MSETTQQQDANILSLMARTWRLGEAVETICYDFENRTVAFHTKSGDVFLAPVPDPDPVNKRTRIQAESNRMTISPRSEGAKPLTKVSVPAGGVISIKPMPGGGFVAPTSEGSLLQVELNGSLRELVSKTFPAPTAIATSDRSSLIAVLLEEEIIIVKSQGSETTRLPLESKMWDIAFSSDGGRVATCGDDGITLWKIGQSPAMDRRLEYPAHHRKIAWSPTGRFISTALADAGLHTWRLADGLSIPMTNYPAPSHHFNWGPGDEFLATSGAYRIVCWPLGDDEMKDEKPTPLETGTIGIVIVTATAAQQKRSLVAAGYTNGIVVVCSAGQPDELIVRGPAQGAITALAWTDDGKSLAIGAQDGFAALVTFPDFMFK